MRLKKHGPPGAVPGLELKAAAAPTRVPLSLMTYTSERVEEYEVDSVKECLEHRIPDGVAWINIDGIGDTELIGHVGNVFGLHPLALEDVIHAPQRPKIEFYENNIYIVLQMFHPQAPEGEQVSIFLGRDFVITLQEKPGDVFEPMRNRIRHTGSLLRRNGADFLAYSLLDAVIDCYFPVLDAYNEEFESVEEEVLDNPNHATAKRIHRLKAGLANLRRIVWPEREVVNALLRHETALVRDETRIYLKDSYDHVIHTFDVIETYRELMGGLMDTYMTSISNKMNSVMKLLTVIATIFMPLTFIAGLYGMNFTGMPELHWKYGYPLSLALMAAVAAGMLLYFRKKQWL
ncbi:MAG TPA: magnesium/cobalt transporter CorA [Planctomycetota bacterium]|nr:magnesium/cobalt transporter CorA [Planctomycetota bacterium]